MDRQGFRMEMKNGMFSLPRALSTVICPTDDRLFHHPALHWTNSLTMPLRESTSNAHRRQSRRFITGLNSVLPTPPNSAHRFVLVTSVCLRRAPLTARLMIHLLALLITGDIIRPSSLTDRLAVSSVAVVVVCLPHTITSS
ncbi:hypothetical protein KP509_01G036800 [Ceratopteris richardii]|uniref:Uncharacterized protein n=1 Tax=Ceratopteris richardii TaxID=49495 RepID=A0A8T2VKD4_CERRI|nr:hypothetical protein KP509_01G036800 [Ceratopteris richardii]